MRTMQNWHFSCCTNGNNAELTHFLLPKSEKQTSDSSDFLSLAVTGSPEFRLVALVHARSPDKGCMQKRGDGASNWLLYYNQPFSLIKWSVIYLTDDIIWVVYNLTQRAEKEAEIKQEEKKIKGEEDEQFKMWLVYFYCNIKQMKCHYGYLKGFRDFQKLQKSRILIKEMGFVTVWLLGSIAEHLTLLKCRIERMDVRP